MNSSSPFPRLESKWRFSRYSNIIFQTKHFDWTPSRCTVNRTPPSDRCDDPLHPYDFEIWVGVTKLRDTKAIGGESYNTLSKKRVHLAKPGTIERRVRGLCNLFASPDLERLAQPHCHHGGLPQNQNPRCARGRGLAVHFCFGAPFG